MAVVINYRHNYRSIGKCATGPELRAAVLDIATFTALPYARSIAPEAEGSYKASLRVDMDVVKLPVEMDPYQHDRVAAHVVADVDHALIVEVGVEGRQEAHRVMTRTLAHLDAGAADG